MDPFLILGGVSSFVGILGTFAGMGASADAYNLAVYNSKINMVNTQAGYIQAKKQAIEGEKAARSNVSTLDFIMGQYTEQQTEYKRQLRIEESSIIGSQIAIQGATGIGGAGTGRKLQQDIVNKVKEYTDIIDKRLLVTGEFDEKGTRIVLSAMDQLLLEQDTESRQADLFAEYAIDAQTALDELLVLEAEEEGQFAETFGEVVGVLEDVADAFVSVGDAIYDFFVFW